MCDQFLILISSSDCVLLVYTITVHISMGGFGYSYWLEQPTIFSRLDVLAPLVLSGNGGICSSFSDGSISCYNQKLNYSYTTCYSAGYIIMCILPNHIHMCIVTQSDYVFSYLSRNHV